ncbi:MAG: class I SAM-dependent methyltransferase [Anaerolineae bacterium]
MSAGLSFFDFLWLGREQWMGYSHPLARLFVRWLGPLGIHARIRNAHILRTIKDLPLPSGARVLDAGCGYAYASFWLARHRTNWEIWGIDTDVKTIEQNQQIAHALGLGNLHFKVGDVAKMKSATPSDLIFSIDVLEHLEDDVEALSNWRQVISETGWLVLHLPLRHQLQKRIFPIFRQHIIADHVRNEYTAEEIEAKLAQAGFTVRSMAYGFGIWGELAFELNYLFWWRSWLRTSLALLTFPLVILLGYVDSYSSLDRGNSLIIQARPSTM